VIQHNHGHLSELQFPRSEKAAVAGEDASLGVHQDRIVEPKAAMLAAICATCASECVRGFRAQGINFSIGHSSMRWAIGYCWKFIEISVGSIALLASEARL
jgi:hypothetical protein